ncbi:hypothetical protein AMTRI_Chr12g273120 [Amborella trichopoda]|uniref:probable serine/threonine-protein kinase At1g54610 n=1 Tax=Amborella trichopoda TaxID=13333 RepID=UPI0009BF112A|nr:probable serine/threonine-protein kinase At1g54610 [Amborella trichopoda]|eukprot:XP_020530837.1 probable serine/threonine-protein kinase At1g54610 [Amborella trichopoda]
MGCASSKQFLYEFDDYTGEFREIEHGSPLRQYNGELEGPIIGSNVNDAGNDEIGRINHGVPRNLPNNTGAEQIAAGWPPWLTAFAGDAIQGWVPMGPDNFSNLKKIGQGAYGNVYRASEVRSGRFVALKRVGFDKCIPESIHFMAREIKILRRLDHPNIVKLEGLVLSRFSRSLYLVFEYMEHDLARLLSRPNIKFNESQIKCLMQQLFLGLDHCHSRGVIHRDIKGSNLLVDGNGVLKVADFGLATFINPRQRRPLTNHVVTLWYRPPELLLGSTDYGNTVDLWSVGCVFAEMIFGEPIFQGRTEVEQLYEIFRLCGSPSDEYWRTCKLPWAAIFKSQQPYEHRLTQTFKFLPQRNLNLLNMLLSVDPTRRGTARAALASEYFLTKPYACDPSSISNTEEDFKHHEMERRRRGGKAHG